jgi:hypothetical protein
MREPRSLLELAPLALALGWGCGSVTADDEDIDAGDPRETTPPEVVSISPGDEASQVMDEPVIIEFSEAMDQVTLAPVFPDGTFSWNAAGTRVEVTTEFPFADTPRAHTITLPITVTDLAGNGLAEPFSVGFVLAELHNVTIDHDPSLSGNQSCQSGTFIQAGDGRGITADTCPDEVNHAGISFLLEGSLPAHGNILRLRRAEVRTQVISVLGDPAALGDFVVERVGFTSRSFIAAPDSFQDQSFGVLFGANGVPIAVGEPVTLDVTAPLDMSWADAVPFQIRVFPGGGSNLDGTSDAVRLRRAGDENDGIVAPGLTEPDEANRMRLEVEYFE